MRPRAMIHFTIGTRRLIKRAGKNAGKSLLGIKPVLQTDVVDLLIGRTQFIRRQIQLALTDVAAKALPFVL